MDAINLEKLTLSSDIGTGKRMCDQECFIAALFVEANVHQQQNG
jgi:hypothetical protein